MFNVYIKEMKKYRLIEKQKDLLVSWNGIIWNFDKFSEWTKTSKIIVNCYADISYQKIDNKKFIDIKNGELKHNWDLKKGV